MDEKTALLYAKLWQHKKRVRMTKGFIKWALKKVVHPYVACSFGKDSAVMLHLILQEVPDIPILWVTFEETDLIDNYRDVVADWHELYNINLHEIKVQASADAEYSDQDAMIAFALENGLDSAFVGIRKEESYGRKASLGRHGMFYKAKNGLTRICPIADWTEQDIAAYTYSNALPLLDTYKNHGISSRTVTGISDDSYSFRSNQLNRIKESDMSKYNQILSAYPELKKYL